MINALRWLHVGAGCVGLFAAPVAMMTLKGGQTHRRFGKIYFWSMLAVAGSALVMAIHRFNPFLLILSIFSFYMALSGYRVLFRKKNPANALDWSAAILTLAASSVMAIVALVNPKFLRVAPIIPIVFSALGIKVALDDIRSFLRPNPIKNAWFFDHMGGMLGSYIGAVSAFSAVNFSFLPPAVRWLWPTIIGIPAIILWERYYQNKFNQGKIPSQ